MVILFIMDFLNNGDLYDYINHENYWIDLKDGNSPGYIHHSKRSKSYKKYIMERGEKLKITVQMIQCIQELHSVGCGIIHCDIKPNNIVLQKDNSLKLIDFGSSLFVRDEDLIVTDWHHGTTGYSSPEDTLYNLLGLPSDIYSLAVSIIEVWCGKIWRGGEDFKECRNEVLRSLRMIEKNDTDIGTFLRKCISLKSEKRPTIEALAEYFSGLVD